MLHLLRVLVALRGPDEFRELRSTPRHLPFLSIAKADDGSSA